MSLNAMSNDLLIRPVEVDEAAAAEGAGPEKEREGFSKALDALGKFIPAEMLAPYVMTLAVGATCEWNAALIYGLFVVATPVFFLLFHFAKIAGDSKPWPGRSDVPALVWRSAAALVAFAVWGICAPTHPFQTSAGTAAIAGLLAVLVSPVLTAADMIVMRLLNEWAARRVKPAG